MLRILPFASLIVLFSSCTTYQYMTVSSNTIGQDVNKDFVMESDSITLRYRFDGHNAPMLLEVENRHSNPIFIDWKRSALILNDQAISFKPGSLSVSGSTYTSASSWYNGRIHGNNSTTTSSDFSSTVSFPGEMEFIPPGSRFSEVPLSITSRLYTGSPGEFKKKNLTLTTGYSGAVNQALYEEDNSPLRFTSYLTLVVEGEQEKRVVFEHSFYVSEILKTGLAPHNFKFINRRDGDHFYVSKVSQGGETAGWILLAGVVIGATAAGYNYADNPGW